MFRFIKNIIDIFSNHILVILHILWTYLMIFACIFLDFLGQEAPNLVMIDE